MQQGLWSLAVGTKKDINNEAHLCVHDVSQPPRLHPRITSAWKVEVWYLSISHLRRPLKCELVEQQQGQPPPPPPRSRNPPHNRRSRRHNPLSPTCEASWPLASLVELSRAASGNLLLLLSPSVLRRTYYCDTDHTSWRWKP